MRIVNRMAGRVGDLAATLFAFAVLLLVPHASVRLILGYGCGWWIPLWLLPCTSCSSCWRPPSRSSPTSSPT